MDLRSVFPNSRVCLFDEQQGVKVWRIIGADIAELNEFRRWLLSSVVGVSIGWVYFGVNTSVFPNEYIAHRLGLVPIDFNPSLLNDFTGESASLCTADTCLRFQIDAYNNTDLTLPVYSGDLRWIPIGDQAEVFTEIPRPLHDDVVLLKLQPLQEIHMVGFAVRGDADTNARWTVSNPNYRLVPTIYPGPPVNISVDDINPISECVPCQSLITDVPCYYFTIELTGGVSFEELQEQIGLRYPSE